jgi:hypothetical protein
MVDSFSRRGAKEIEPMQAHRMLVTVPEDRRTVIELPESVPPGQVELIVLVAAEREETPEKASPEALARWDAAAAEVGLEARSFRELTPEERRARLRRLRGVGRGLLPSSQEFLRQKREEVELEDLRRCAAIDAAFTQMAVDRDYRREAVEIAEELESADWEALR